MTASRLILMVGLTTIRRCPAANLNSSRANYIKGFGFAPPVGLVAPSRLALGNQVDNLLGG